MADMKGTCSSCVLQLRDLVGSDQGQRQPVSKVK